LAAVFGSISLLGSGKTIADLHHGVAAFAAPLPDLKGKPALARLSALR